MNEPAEEVSSAMTLVGEVRESISCSREPAHLYGLIRGLDIALSTLRNPRADLSAAARELRERAARLTSVDAYRSGVAIGLELASHLTVSWLHRYSQRTPS